MAEEPEELDQDLDTDEEEEEPIRLPPGWGPIVFLAAVVIASNIGLGMYLRGVMATPGAAGIPMEAGAQHGPPPTAGAAGGPPPGTEAGRPPQSDYQVDPAEFTPELDAYLKQVAAENGIPEEEVGTAREIYEQMSRSGLLPRNSDLDLRTVLSGHLIERAKHPEEAAKAQSDRAGLPPPGSMAPGQKPAEGGMPGQKPPEGGKPGQKPPEGADGKKPPPDMPRPE